MSDSLKRPRYGDPLDLAEHFLSEPPTEETLNQILTHLEDCGLYRITAKEDTMSDVEHNGADNILRSEYSDALPVASERDLYMVYKTVRSADVTSEKAMPFLHLEDLKLSMKRFPPLRTLLKFIGTNYRDVPLKAFRRLRIPDPEQGGRKSKGVRLSTNDTEGEAVRDQERSATEKAWEQPFQGPYRVVFVNSLRRMREAAHSASDHYSNVLAIVQSSGTGKSRLVHEAASLVLTLPLTVRSQSDPTAYPPPDVAVRDFLFSAASKALSEAKAHIAALFVALFRTAATYINTRLPRPDHYTSDEALAYAWKEYLEMDGQRIRRTMYGEVIEAAKELLAPHSPFSSKSWLGMTADGSSAVRSLIDAMNQRLSPADAGANWLRVCLYADEVHTLTDKYTTASPDDGSRTILSVLTSVWTDLGPAQPTFLILLSTNSQLRELAAPPTQQLSKRGGSQTAVHQAPYTELPFDVLVPDGEPIFHRGRLTIKEVADVSFFSKLGRPLFRTRYEVAKTHKLTAVTESIIDFAFSKLTGYSRSDYQKLASDGKLAWTSAARLSPIATRLLLDFDVGRKQARDLEMEMVESTMRMMHSVPAHRDYGRTGTPSEPILAEASAFAWNEPSCRLNPLEAMQNLLDNGLIEKGARGELVARFLLIRAYDEAAKEQWKATHRTVLGGLPPIDDACYSQPVPVIDFLKALIAPQYIQSVLDSHADSPPPGKAETIPLKDAFKNACVRFNHFGKNGYKNRIDTYAGLAAVARGMAIQGAPNQEDIDIAIPVVMDASHTLDDPVMSYILVQVKDRRQAQRVVIDEKKIGVFPKSQNDGHHPYIALVMQLGYLPATESATSQFHERAPAPPSTPPRKGKARDVASSEPQSFTTPSRIEPMKQISTRTLATKQHPRYYVNILGCSSSVYNVVSKSEKDVFAGLLAVRGIFEEHARNQPENLTLVKRTKPEWQRETAFYDWTDIAELRITPRSESTGEGEVLTGELAEAEAEAEAEV